MTAVDERYGAIQGVVAAIAFLPFGLMMDKWRWDVFSGKTPAGAVAALEWADVLMVEYHLNDESHADVIAASASRGVGVVVKKGLASGHLPPSEALRFVLGNPHVASVIVGGTRSIVTGALVTV